MFKQAQHSEGLRIFLFGFELINWNQAIHVEIKTEKTEA
jgi:hypothetical protein